MTMNTTDSAIACAATNPGQWITLYADGRVRVHTVNLDSTGVKPYRTLTYRPKLKSDREAIRRLIGHLNLVAAAHEGAECNVRDCGSPAAPTAAAALAWKGVNPDAWLEELRGQTTESADTENDQALAQPGRQTP